MISYKIEYETKHKYVPISPTNESYKEIDDGLDAYYRLINELEENKSVCGNFTVDLKRVFDLPHDYSYYETVTCYKGEVY